MLKETKKQHFRAAAIALAVVLAVPHFAFAGDNSPNTGLIKPTAKLISIAQPSVPITTAQVVKVPSGSQTRLASAGCAVEVVHQDGLLQQSAVINLNQSAECLSLTARVSQSVAPVEIKVARLPTPQPMVKVVSAYLSGPELASGEPAEKVSGTITLLGDLGLGSHLFSKWQVRKPVLIPKTSYSITVSLEKLQVYRC